MTKRKLSLYRRTLATACCTMTIMAAMPATSACPFTDGNWDLTNNGIVFSRYASALTGSPLVANTRFSSTDPATVKRDLDNQRGPLDMNGDAQITSVDSAIVARHIAGYRGASLTSGVNLGATPRDTAEKVLPSSRRAVRLPSARARRCMKRCPTSLSAPHCSRK